MQTHLPDSNISHQSLNQENTQAIQFEARDLIQQAIGFHQQGDLMQAQTIYQQVLSQQAKNFDALHLLGVIAAQQGDHETAQKLIEQALEIDSKHDFVWLNRGNALRELQRWEQAQNCFQQAVTRNPSNIEAWQFRQFLGDSFKAMSQHQQAVDCYQHAISLNPKDEAILLKLAILLRLLNRDVEALEMFARVIILNPKNAEAYRERANFLLERAKHYQAINDFDAALNLQPQDAQSLFNRGVAYAGINHFNKSLESYDQCLKISDANAALYFNRGVALEQLGRLEESLASYEQAISQKYDFIEAHLNRGNVLKSLGRREESVFAFDKMIALRPDYAEAYNNRANGLRKLGQLDRAMSDYESAIRLKPDYHEAFNNRGNMLKDIGCYERSMQDYDRALALKPDYVSCYWNKSLLLILLGDYLNGWKLYEWRMQEPHLKDKHYRLATPGWRGESSLQGKTILIYAEQGYGDVIQFARYIPLLKAQGANILFEVFQPLYHLFKSMRCEMTLISVGDNMPPFDTYCPVMSLPYAMKTTIDTIPAEIPYLFADPEKVMQYKKILGQTKQKRIGLVWSGSTKHENDANRSLSLDAFDELLQLDVQWHSLQKEYRLHDEGLLHQYFQLAQHQDTIQDFSDTAALIECMDLVITVDTSVAHLAGAMGKPVWILIPFAPDYRWLLEREDSPWYPNATLFRQPALHDWDSVLSRLVSALQQYLKHS